MPGQHSSPDTNIPRPQHTSHPPPLHDNQDHPQPSPTITDTQDWGSPIPTKQETTLRLYFQNIHGLSTRHVWTDWHSILNTVHQKDIDIFGLAETNIPWTPTTRHIAKQQMKQHLNHTQISLAAAACDEATLGRRQPGGVCQGAIGPIVGGIDSTHNDSLGLGRWTYMTITCKHSCKLHIITAYRVSQTSLPQGDDTAYHQQFRTLRRMGHENPNPRKQFIHDLIDLVQNLKQTGEVIVMMDSNAPIQEKYMMLLLSQTGLYNTMEYVHNEPPPRTYLRGRNTIDHILATSKVLPAISQAGMLAFNDGIQSDHRGLWLDLHLAHLMQIPTTPYQHSTLAPNTRHLKQCKYLKEEFTKQYKELSIQEQVDSLLNKYHTMTKSEATITLNEIDTLIDTAMLKPLKTAPKQYTPWWSPAIQQSHLILQYWKLCGTERALGIDFSTQKQSIRTQLPEDADVYQDNPDATIQKQLRLARKNLATLRRNSFELRQQHLETLAQQYETLTNQCRTKILRNMKRQEYMRHVYQKITRYLKPTSRKRLHKVQTTDANGHQTEHTTKDEMETILLEHHGNHFSQAHGTPFTVPPLSSHYQHILDPNHKGNQTIPEPSHHTSLHPDLKAFLNELQPSPLDPPPIDTSLTLNHLKQGFRIWNENTSTSPLGRQLSLYKMWITEPGSHDGKIIPGDTFFQLILDLITIAQKLQVPLTRWTIVHNIFIQKKSNDYRPHRLRALHKIDAELNLIRRELIAKRLLRNAEQYNYLDDSNYGGRNGKTANDAVMKKFLTLQIWQLKRHNGALTDCDAKACYDRVVPNLLYMCYNKAGLPPTTCQWLNKCLSQMKYHVVTTHGISEGYSTSTDHKTLYGVGQGATDAPTGWLLVSTILSRYYNQKAIGCILHDPTNTSWVTWKHVMFVDDTYLIHASPDPLASLQTLETIVEHDVTQWNTGLHITGGKLEGDKSNYFILIWDFSSNGLPFLQTHDNTDNPVRLHLYDTPTNPLTRIRHDEHPSQFKSLGTYLTGALDTKYEQQVIHDKIQKFIRFLVTCPLRPNEAWIAYRQYLIPSLMYGAIIQSFSISTCETMHRKLLPYLLPKLGYPNTFPRPLAFGPKKSGGSGILDFNAIILSSKIQYVLKHLRANTEIGKMLQITLSWAQLQAGIGTPILSQPRRLPYIESEWLKHLHEGLWQISGRIYIPDAWHERYQCQNDRFLMELFYDSGIYTAHQLHILNCCRLYLKISRLSDIRTTDGRKIIPAYYYGTHENTYTALEWPAQRNPDSTAWTLWRKALSDIAPLHHNIPLPLGTWTSIANKYNWYYNTITNTIYSNSGRTWYAHPTTSTRRHVKWSTQRQIDTRPASPIPICEVQHTSTQLYSSHPRNMRNKSTTHQTPTWHQKQQHITHEYYNTFTITVPSPTTLPIEAQLRLSSEIYIISHSGMHDHFGYFGWVVATDSNIVAKHKGFAPGNHEDMDLQRAALAAIVHALLWLQNQLTSQHTNTDQTIHLGSTNRKAIQKIQTYVMYDTWFPNEMLKPHLDIILEIIALIDKLPQTPEMEYHKAPAHKEIHQIPKTNWRRYLFSHAVHMATVAYDTIKRTTPLPPPVTYSHSKAVLYINNTCVHKHHNHAIHRAWCTSDLRQYITKKFNWTNTTSDLIDWYSFGSAIRTMHRIHPWIVKFTHEWLPLKSAPWISTQTTQCPICLQHPETPHHFLTCSLNPTSPTELDQRLTNIYLTHNVDPNLQIILNTALQYPTTFTDTILLQAYPDFPTTKYEGILWSQSQIGWKMLHYGRFSLAWDRYQRNFLYTQGLNTPSSEPAWLKQLICAILHYNHTRWLKRNEILHKREPIDIAEHDQLLTRITALYSLSSELLQIDQYCFTKSLADWRLSSTYDMKKWLQIYTPHIRKCRMLAIAQRKRSTSDIRTYVTTPPTAHRREAHGPQQINRPTPTPTHPNRPQIQRTVNEYFARINPPNSHLDQQTLDTPTPSQAHSNLHMASCSRSTSTESSIATDLEPTEDLTHPEPTAIQTSLTKYFTRTT